MPVHASSLVPACQRVPPFLPPHGNEARVKLRAYHNTHYVPVHNKAVTPPPYGKEACVKTRAYHNTHYVPVHNTAFDERPAFGGDTGHR